MVYVPYKIIFYIVLNDAMFFFVPTKFSEELNLEPIFIWQMYKEFSPTTFLIAFY